MTMLLLLPLLPGASAVSSSGAQEAKLSSISILGYYQYRNPQDAAWYLSHFGSDFSGFFYMNVPLGDVTEYDQINSLAAQYPDVTFYVQIVIPSSYDLFNVTQYAEVESGLKQALMLLNSTNVKGIEISALYMGQWAIPWVKNPPGPELQAWYSWLSENGLPRVPFAQNGTVYTPLFAEWAVSAAAQLAAGLVNFSRSVRPDLEYGVSQYDSLAIDDDSVQSLYTFYEVVKPNFIITDDLAVARPVQGYSSYPFSYLVLVTPMAPSYYRAVGARLMVDDSFAAVTSTSGDTIGMALFKFELNELSTYLMGATPLVDAMFVGPHGNYVPLQEFVLNPSLQINISSLPKPSVAPAPVLVIRPTFSVGNINVSGYYQQELFYSLIRMGVPFNYVSEAYVYSNPSVLRDYRYVIYASDQITPQMCYILSHDNSSIKVGLRSTYLGYIKSSMPGTTKITFNVFLQNYNATSLSFLGRELPGTLHQIHFGDNVLSWNSSGIYVNGVEMSVKSTDYLGLMGTWFTALHVAILMGVFGLAILVFSAYRGYIRAESIRKVLERTKSQPEEAS